MKRLARVLLVLAFAVLMHGCSSGLSDIEIVRLGRPIHPGEIDTLTVFGLNQAGATNPVVADWTLEGECAVLLNSTGYAADVLAVEPGRYRVTAIKGNLTDVKDFDIYLPITTSIFCVNKNPEKRLEIQVGSSCDIRAYGFDQFGREAWLDLEWNVTEGLGEFTELEDIVCYSRVSFKATKGGIGWITASEGEASNSFMVVVSPYEQIPTEFVITPASREVRTPGTAQFYVTMYDQIGKYMDIDNITWELVGDIGRLFPSSGGGISILFVAEKEGTGTLTASYGDFTATAVISVSASAPYSKSQ